MSHEDLSAQEKITRLETEIERLKNDLDINKKEYEEFLLIASHDLQAPLRKLTTFVDRLSSKYNQLSEEEAKSLMARISSASTNMRSLVDSLASLSALSEELSNFEKCDLINIFNKVITDFQENHDEKEIKVDAVSLPVIQGNSVYLKHLFQNLIGNAIKFKKKDIALQLTVISEILNDQSKAELKLPADLVYQKIEIIDNGIGFDKENAEKIFKPFQRLHGKSEYAGNGLGLSICKKIVEKHNGLIYANAIENIGARFILILPETHK